MVIPRARRLIYHSLWALHLCPTRRSRNNQGLDGWGSTYSSLCLTYASDAVTQSRVWRFGPKLASCCPDAARKRAVVWATMSLRLNSFRRNHEQEASYAVWRKGTYATINPCTCIESVRGHRWGDNKVVQTCDAIECEIPTPLLFLRRCSVLFSSHCQPRIS